MYEGLQSDAREYLPLARRAFQRVFLSTESKADSMSTNADSVALTVVIEPI